MTFVYKEYATYSFTRVFLHFLHQKKTTYLALVQTVGNVSWMNDKGLLPKLGN